MFLQIPKSSRVMAPSLLKSDLLALPEVLNSTSQIERSNSLILVSQLASPCGFLEQSVPNEEYSERLALKFLTTLFLVVGETSWACE